EPCSPESGHLTPARSLTRRGSGPFVRRGAARLRARSARLGQPSSESGRCRREIPPARRLIAAVDEDARAQLLGGDTGTEAPDPTQPQTEENPAARRRDPGGAAASAAHLFEAPTCPRTDDAL